MQSIKDILENDKTLQRRQRIYFTIDRAVNEDAESVEKLLQLIGQIYHRGTISRFWDFIGALAGADRGYGNDWFYSAVELLKRKKEKQYE